MASAFTRWWSNTRVTAPTADDNKIRRAASDIKINVPHPDLISSPSCFTLLGIPQDLEYSASPAAALTRLWISWRGCVDGQWCLSFTKKELFNWKFPPESSYSDASFYWHMKEKLITSTFEKLQVFRACDELGNESAVVWTMPCLCRHSRETAT